MLAKYEYLHVRCEILFCKTTIIDTMMMQNLEVPRTEILFFVTQ